MSAKIVTAKIGSDGMVVQVLPDGTEQSFPETPIRPMTEAEVAAAAAADSDALPMNAGTIFYR